MDSPDRVPTSRPDPPDGPLDAPVPPPSPETAGPPDAPGDAPPAPTTRRTVTMPSIQSARGPGAPAPPVHPLGSRPAPDEEPASVPPLMTGFRTETPPDEPAPVSPLLTGGTPNPPSPGPPAAQDGGFIGGFQTLTDPPPPPAMPRAASVPDLTPPTPPRASASPAEQAAAPGDASARELEEIAATVREVEKQVREARTSDARRLEETAFDGPERGPGPAFAGSLTGADLPDFTPPAPPRPQPAAPVTAGDDVMAEVEEVEASAEAMVPAAGGAEPASVDDLDRALAEDIDDLMDAESELAADLHDDPPVRISMEDSGEWTVEAAPADEWAGPGYLDDDEDDRRPPVAAPEPAKCLPPPAQVVEEYESIDDLLGEDLGDPARDTQPAGRPEPSPAPRAAPEPDAAQPVPEVLPGANSRLAAAARRQERHPWLGTALAGLVAVLQGINLPLRFVPPRLRLVVDLIALTMIFWVPIVWAMAMFVAG